MKNKKDIEIKRQYLRDLKKQVEKGDLTSEELYNYVLNELKTFEPEEDFESVIKRFFFRKD
ncbi:hypothetical protein [Aquimarina algiphila]|uniref:Uncharacterized protein n=1 Tax=Aquimarina algiphila TaxID=2047982 RepID=A0A554VNQ1_9FLAO|nr:hypothetical protein [Aquimarina algiphila]TSE09995.1 hypothetical protein FOF46_06755 [Aquimarina algiphila]